jgi:hypothetical protein
MSATSQPHAGKEVIVVVPLDEPRKHVVGNHSVRGLPQRRPARRANVASYKFALAKSILSLAEAGAGIHLSENHSHSAFGDIIRRFSFYAPYQLDPQACETMIFEIQIG